MFVNDIQAHLVGVFIARISLGLRKGSTAGSFVRPNRSADSPRSFLEALRYKYASDSGSTPEEVHGSLIYVSKNGPRPAETMVKISGKEVEEVGFDKIRKQLAKLHELRIVLLDGLCMSQPVDPETKTAWLAGDISAPPNSTAAEILKTCPKIAELDLSRNLFEDWVEIVFICQKLSNLRDLRLEWVSPSFSISKTFALTLSCSGNRFRNTSIPREAGSAVFSILSNIQKLSLEDTLLSWTEVCQILSRNI